MRIAVVSNFRGGLKQFATSLCEGLIARGFEVDVLCPAHARISDTHRPNKVLPVYSGVSAVRRLLVGKYDLIHCNIASLGLLPIINRKTKRTPIVETFHGFPQWWVESKIFDKVSYAAEFNAIQILANFANSRTSISNFVRSTILKALNIDSVVVHNGIATCPLLSPTQVCEYLEVSSLARIVTLNLFGR
jgi:hypothetical protein